MHRPLKEDPVDERTIERLAADIEDLKKSVISRRKKRNRK